MKEIFEEIIEQLKTAKNAVPVNRILDDIINDKPKELGQLIAYDNAIKLVEQEADKYNRNMRAMEDQASRHGVNEVWSIYDVTGREYKGIEKKILPEYYNAVISGSKTFELRKDEDNIQAGDFIVLKEWDGKRYTGRQTWRRAKYVLRDVPEYGLCLGYCIVGW